MNLETLLAELKHVIETYTPSASLWCDIYELYNQGREVLGTARCREEVLPHLSVWLGEHWSNRQRIFTLENEPDDLPWELGYTLHYRWDYHQMHGDALAAIGDLCESGALAHVDTLILEYLGEKKLEELLDKLERGCPNISTLRFSLSEQLEDRKKTMPEVLEVIQNHIIARADKLDTLEVVIPQRTRKRRAMLEAVWEMLYQQLEGSSGLALRRFELHFGDYNTKMRSEDALSGFFERLRGSTIKELGLINMGSLNERFVLGELQEKPDHFEGLETLLINGVGSRHEDFWSATRWLEEPRFFRTRAIDPSDWYPWEDEGWRLEAKITEALLADDGRDIRLLEPSQTELELHCSTHGIEIDELRVLVGDNARPKQHEHVLEITVWQPRSETMAFFLEHAARAFPNLSKLNLKTTWRLAPPESPLPKRCFPKLGTLIIEHIWGEALLTGFDFPALHTLHLGSFGMDVIAALCANHERFPNLKKLELYSYSASDGARTDLIFNHLREAGVLGRLEHFYMDIMNVGGSREAACNIADLVFSGDLPLGWRRELFEAIREPTTKKVLYTLLRHTGAAVQASATREELDAMWASHVPAEIWSFEWSEITHINDLTQFDVF